MPRHTFRSPSTGRSSLFFSSGIAATAIAQGNGDRYVGPSFATRAPVIAQNGMAATMQPLASQIAIDVLKKGGTAMDAAIAANAALGLDGAGLLRHRRRPVRHRLGSEDQEALRLQRLRPLAARTLLRRHAAQARRPRLRSGIRLALRDRAGHGRCLVRAARPLRQTADGRSARAGDRLCARRLSGHAVHLGAVAREHGRRCRARPTSKSSRTRRRPI